jgi:two-component system sensor histidine kinase DesK
MGSEIPRHILKGWVIQFVLAAVLTASFGANWAGLFVYVAATGGRLKPVWAALCAVLLSAAACAVQLALSRSYQEMLALVITSAMVGLMMVSLNRLVWTGRQLQMAQGEVARLATVEERLRIARDIHDLLGHSLSVITLKADLAARLLPNDPARAAAEIADVQVVARRSLTEVREAVAGYRRLRLADELARARNGLEAAGVRCAFTTTAGELPERAEVALAWVVREAATNVLRHSRARTCRIEVTHGKDGAQVIVEDDGSGATEATAHDGSGLAGLTERMRAAGGSLEAGPVETGGFRVRGVIPLGPKGDPT